ncbi:MAG: 1-acyl-sn-glycerol-3-phosphate acyltransferase [Flavobacteriales bacterium]|nr:1-acyl-sn-glycerol-3-phosphate acyltransferase [Flavobacteriales bacterium]
MIYSFLKKVCTLALRVYFRKMHVYGREHIPVEGPYLVVANHPSSFLDPLCIATQLKPKLNFLAKAVMFKNKLVASILRGLNMLPIYRAQDDPGLLNKNKEVFQGCYDKLAKNGVIMIFPEGTSEAERRLRKIKTGAARIALGAEQENNFSLNLKILPVGLNYTKSCRFRSEVIVNFGEPIAIKDYLEMYQANGMNTVKQLTDDIENSIRNLMIAIDEKEQDELVEQIEHIFKTSLPQEVDAMEQVKLSQGIVDAIRFYQKNDPRLYDDMAGNLDQFFRKLESVGLSYRSFEKIDKRKRLIPEMLRSAFALIIGFPLWLFGIITNYIPYKLPRFFALRITKSEAFYGALLMSLGTFIFILFYSMEIYLFWRFTQLGILTLCFGAILILTGFFTILYARNARRLYFDMRLLFKLIRKKELMKELARERITLINHLNLLKDQYLINNSVSD